ncbi:uncharacterized protein IUM83_14556 [Phytophthora cinnamomi]|uniref:uncharacterized protein n=1 Tax=Phytophthora cinnamomi TaxID=4785 RepID=UPI00355A3D66|nr:hypothetical protein IUM83_14556 [Phytophthora cinnamomi]
MLRGVNRADDETDDEILAELMREEAGWRPSSARQGGDARESRWRQFMAAVMFLSQVFVELGRRGLRCLQRSVPRYVAFVDRWLVQSIRVSVHPRKKMSTLRLLLALGVAFALPYIVFTIGRMRADELDDEKIRSLIIVDRVDARAGPSSNVPARRRRRAEVGRHGATMREYCPRREAAHGCYGLCVHAIAAGQGEDWLLQRDRREPPADKAVHVRSVRYEPAALLRRIRALRVLLHAPLNTGIRRDYLTHADPNHPVYSDPAEITVFQYCQYRCRTSSASVQHQNSYRRLPHRSFCYGIHRPLKVLPTVNSDGLHDEWRARDHLVPAAQLELDPFYRDYAVAAD